MGTERPLEVPPVPIHQKLSPPVAMERDGRCLPSPWQRAGTADRRIAGLGKTFCSSQCRTAGGSSASETGTWGKWTNFSLQEPQPLSSRPPPVVLLSGRRLSVSLPLVWQVAAYPALSQTLSLYPQAAREALVTTALPYRGGIGAQRGPKVAQPANAEPGPRPFPGPRTFRQRGGRGPCLQPAWTQTGRCVQRGRPRGARLASCRGMPREGRGPRGEVIKSRAEAQGPAAGRVFSGRPASPQSGSGASSAAARRAGVSGA